MGMNMTRVVCLFVGLIFLNSFFASPANAGGGGSATYVLSLSAGGLWFGNQSVGATGSLPLNINNTGTGSVTVSKVTASGTGYSIGGFTGSVTIAAGQSLALTVKFAPPSAGYYSGSVTIVSTASSSPVSIPLAGNGVGSSATYLLSMSAGGLGFGNQTVGTTGSQTLSISNTGTGSVTISQVSTTGTGYSIGGFSGPVTLAAGKSLSLTVKFAPAAAGYASGTLTVASNPSNSSLSIPLSGTGVAGTLQLSVSPTSLSFGSVNTGSKTSQSLSITNTGTSAVTISQVASSGTGFSVSGFSGSVTLAAGQSLALSASFAPTASGTAAGAISVVSTAANSPLSIPLSGTGTGSSATYVLSLSAGGLGFGSQTVGTTGSQPLSINNTGTGSVTVSQVSTTGAGYSVGGFSSPVTLAPGKSLALTVNFAPATAGYVSGSATVVSTATNSPQTIPLSGTGVGSSLQLTASPASLSFGSLNVGSSASQPFTLTNTGNSSVTVSQVTASGTGFTLGGFSGSINLAAGQSLSLTASFAPNASGSVSGNISVVSAAANSPTISLSGTGVQPLISVVPSSVSFGSVSTGVTNTQTVTVQNPGTATLTIAQASLTGTGYSLSGLSTPLSIAAGASASFNVAFAPASAGSFSGSLALTSNAPASPTSIALSGTGVTATLQLSASPSSISFGSQTAGTSASQTLTVTNSGNSSVTISQVAPAGTGFSICSIALPLTLSAGQSTSCSVTFAPSAAGSVAGSVTVTSNAKNSPLVVALSGTGTASATYSVSLNWSPSSSSYEGFNVYRGTVSGGPYTKMDSTMVPSPAYTDSTVAAGQTYYYVATEVDNTGTESGYSSEVTAAIP